MGMEFTGKTIGTGYHDSDITITFTINERSSIYEEYTKLKDCEKLRIKVEKYREKRSLDANNYAWKLMSEIAEDLTTSKDEVYETMLEQYGTNALDDDGNLITISVPAKVNIKNADIHCAFMGKGWVDGKEFNHYRVIKGSSMYDTREMSKFIDGIVSEAKERGIQTMTPDDLRQMKERWGV
jgi:hypothetical protein